MLRVRLYRNFFRKIQECRHCEGKGAQKGVSAIEFALVFPLFIALVVGTIEMFWQCITALEVQKVAEDVTYYLETGNTEDPNLMGQCLVNRNAAVQQLIQWDKGAILKNNFNVEMSGITPPIQANNRVTMYVFSYTQPYLTYWAQKYFGGRTGGGMTHTVRITVNENQVNNQTQCMMGAQY